MKKVSIIFIIVASLLSVFLMFVNGDNVSDVFAWSETDEPIYIGSIGGYTEPGELNAPSDITLDAEGNIYIADTLNCAIQKFSSAGEFITKFGSFGRGDGQFYRQIT